MCASGGSLWNDSSFSQYRARGFPEIGEHGRCVPIVVGACRPQPVTMILRLAALLPRHRVRVVEADQPPAIGTVQRERAVRPLRLLRRRRHPCPHQGGASASPARRRRARLSGAHPALRHPGGAPRRRPPSTARGRTPRASRISPSPPPPPRAASRSRRPSAISRPSAGRTPIRSAFLPAARRGRRLPRWRRGRARRPFAGSTAAGALRTRRQPFGRRSPFPWPLQAQPSVRSAHRRTRPIG